MDLAINETLNGGDLMLVGNDLALQIGWGNMPYLGMFGGNKAAVTKEKFVTEQDLSWWGNNLLMPQDQSIQFNSLLEKLLDDISLNSNSRVAIENIIKQDLKFMLPIAVIFVSVALIAIDRIKIVIKVQQPNNLNGTIPDQYKGYIFIWDATQKTLGDFSLEDFNDDFYK